MKEKKMSGKTPAQCSVSNARMKKFIFYTQSWPYICSEKSKITKISKLPTIQEGYFRKNYKNLVKRGSTGQKV